MSARLAGVRLDQRDARRRHNDLPGKKRKQVIRRRRMRDEILIARQFVEFESCRHVRFILTNPAGRLTRPSSGGTYASISVCPRPNRSGITQIVKNCSVRPPWRTTNSSWREPRQVPCLPCQAGMQAAASAPSNRSLSQRGVVATNSRSEGAPDRSHGWSETAKR